MPYTEMETTEFKLTLIAEHAKRNRTMKFMSIAHLLNADFLLSCFKSLNRNKATGIDNVTWYEYNANLYENIERLVERLKSKSYTPIPAKRVYIPKGDGKRRPLGISAIENKIVELGIKRILESIYEQDFSNQSFGFRPERSCHHALKEIHQLVTYNPTNHIVEADIKGFFDNVNHDLLMEALGIRISDKSMLMLIEKFLKAGYIDDGLLVTSEKGTPQGSILSPILANVFLHYVLDYWFENTVKTITRGFCEIVRYADDFVCTVQYIDDAIKIERMLVERFNKLKLEIHPDKSKRITFGRFESQSAKKQGRRPNTFTFLGITHYCTKSRRGGFKIGRKTCRKKFREKCNKLKAWIKKNRHLPIRVFWDGLAVRLRGHYQYYGVSENSKSIDRFYRVMIKSVHKWLNRRSQRGRMTWQKLNDYLNYYPLPRPSIKHSFYTKSMF